MASALRATRAQRRLERERRTIEAMVLDFCRARHAPPAGACEECSGLMEYARRRLERCPFGEQKPTCVNCPIHCYQPKIRDQMKAVMRFSGPRMLLRHPVLALRHWLDAYREAPAGHQADRRSRPS
jgi:YbgA-like uncharacterized protein